MGDAVIAAFFIGIRAKEREAARAEVQAGVEMGGLDWRQRLTSLSAGLRVIPFHWTIELPEAFDRRNGGFDAIIGKPPFLGGRRMKQVLSEEFQCWLDELHRGSRNADLVAQFFRRAFSLLRDCCCLGLIAAVLLLTLRGTQTLYYGDELGMHDVPIPHERIQDPWEKGVPGLGLGRDPERTPMQWSAEPHAGFTSGRPWRRLRRISRA